MVLLKLKDNSNGLGLTTALPPFVCFDGGRFGIGNGVKNKQVKQGEIK